MQTPPVLPGATSSTAIPSDGFAAGGDALSSADPFAVIFARLLGTPASTSLDVTGLADPLATTAAVAEPAATIESSTNPLVRIDPRLAGRLADQFDIPPEILPIAARDFESLNRELPTLPADAAAKTAESTTLGETPVADTAAATTLLSALTTLAVVAPVLGPVPTSPAPSVPIAASSIALAAVPIENLLASSTASAVVEEGTQAAIPTRGRLNPFQVSPLTQPRRVGTNLARELAKEGLATSSLSVDPSVLGGQKPGRLVIDKDILKSVEKLLPRVDRTDLAERGLSVLAPDELRTDRSSVEDRNATALARVDRQEFVDRIIQALERARAEQPKKIEIELNPPSLGKLRVQVIDHDGQLTAKIEVHSGATRTLLLDNLPNLDRQLGEQGVQIQRFQVDQVNTGSSGLQDPTGGTLNQQSPGSGQQGQPNKSSNKDDAEVDEGDAVLTIADLLGWADGMDRLV